MTNSDFLLKATIKKVTEKLNEIVVEKIEEAARMENEVNKGRNADTSESNQDPYLSEVLKEIKDIKGKIDHFNKRMNNTI